MTNPQLLSLALAIANLICLTWSEGWVRDFNVLAATLCFVGVFAT